MSPELIAICKQLIQAGKPVSVGMIKSRAPKHTPLPAIVQAVQFCKTQAAAVLKMETPQQPVETENAGASDQELMAKMAKKIAELEKRILALEQKLG